MGKVLRLFNRLCKSIKLDLNSNRNSAATHSFYRFKIITFLVCGTLILQNVNMYVPKNVRAEHFLHWKFTLTAPAGRQRETLCYRWVCSLLLLMKRMSFIRIQRSTVNLWTLKSYQPVNSLVSSFFRSSNLNSSFDCVHWGDTNTWSVSKLNKRVCV